MFTPTDNTGQSPEPGWQPTEPTSYPPEAARSAPRLVRIQHATERPLVVYVLIALNILVFLLQLASQSLMRGIDVPAMYGMKVNELIAAGQFWRLVTPMFLHGSIWHIGFNMYALFVIGKGLEKFYGHGRFMALYFLAGFTGNVLSFLLQPASSLGASTAIFGLIGAEAIFLYQNRRVLGKMAQQALRNVLSVLLLNLIISITAGGIIDLWGHLGGLIGGSLFAWFAGPILAFQQEGQEVVVVDKREQASVVRTALVVGLFFALLVAVVIFLA
jgi:rhomboid protease GluP